MKELRKRPFARPLFIWIAGIVLQTYLPVGYYSLLLLLIPVCLLFVSCLIHRARPLEPSYEARWVWGVVFISLLLFLSIQLTAYHQKRSPSTSPNQWEVAAGKAQQRLMKPIDELSLPDAEKTVLAALTLGAQQLIPREVRQQFSVTGVAHILSVSGFHVAIVCGFLSLFLSLFCSGRVGDWIKYILLILLLWTYTAITGLAVASIRAATMLTLFLTAKVLGRTYDNYNTLAAAAFCMLVYNPFYLFNIGFQLSFTAVWSILFFQPRLRYLMDVRNPLLSEPWGWVTVTLAAQIGVTFLCLYYFGYFSLVFLFTNLPLTLIATLLIPTALLWLLLPGWLPGMETLQYAVETLTHSMVWIVDAFSRIPGSTLTFRFTLPMTLLSYASLLLFCTYLCSKRPRLLLASLFCILVVLVLMLISKMSNFLPFDNMII